MSADGEGCGEDQMKGPHPARAGAGGLWGVVEGAGLARAGNPTAACSSLKGSCKVERAEVFFNTEVIRRTSCWLGFN